MFLTHLCLLSPLILISIDTIPTHFSDGILSDFDNMKHMKHPERRLSMTLIITWKVLMSSRLPLLNSLQCFQCLVSTTFRIRRWRASAISCKVEESALRYRSTPSFPVLGAQSRYARSTIQPLLYGASECIDRVWLKQWEREMALLLE